MLDRAVATPRHNDLALLTGQDIVEMGEALVTGAGAAAKDERLAQESEKVQRAEGAPPQVQPTSRGPSGGSGK